eukprot:gene3727-4775_t
MQFMEIVLIGSKDLSAKKKKENGLPLRDALHSAHGLLLDPDFMMRGRNGSVHSRYSQRSDNIMGGLRTVFAQPENMITFAEKPVKRLGRRQRHLASLEEGEDRLQNR